MTPILQVLRGWQPELAEIRRDLHAHPELGLVEHRTAARIAALLRGWGLEVHEGIGGTGVVGVLRSGRPGPFLGLRAEMDALPISEATGLPYASRHAGTMHACGHDGHSTMLLGAARYLAETRAFEGTLHIIFQPGEEGAGGALAMLADGLFDRFPCDTIHALHNRPGLPVGRFAIVPGVAMAAGAFFDITITGKGGHGARPEVAVDPVLVACQIATAAQGILPRSVSAAELAVLTVTTIRAGHAHNIIPEEAYLGGTVRALSRARMAELEARLRALACGIAQGFGVTCTVDFRLIFAPLVNDADATQAMIRAAEDLVGVAQVDRDGAPNVASEDFSFMLEKVPGAYMLIGNGLDSAPVHNPRYDFNDAALPYGAALFALMARARPAT